MHVRIKDFVLLACFLFLIPFAAADKYTSGTNLTTSGTNSTIVVDQTFYADLVIANGTDLTLHNVTYNDTINLIKIHRSITLANYTIPNGVLYSSNFSCFYLDECDNNMAGTVGEVDGNLALGISLLFIGIFLSAALGLLTYHQLGSALIGSGIGLGISGIGVGVIFLGGLAQGTTGKAQGIVNSGISLGSGFFSQMGSFLTILGITMLLALLTAAAYWGWKKTS